MPEEEVFDHCVKFVSTFRQRNFENICVVLLLKKTIGKENIKKQTVN